MGGTVSQGERSLKPRQRTLCVQTLAQFQRSTFNKFQCDVATVVLASLGAKPSWHKSNFQACPLEADAKRQNRYLFDGLTLSF